MFKSQSLDEFLAELSSRNPTPGGGTAAGLAAAMGVALTEMVAHVVGSHDDTEKLRFAPFVERCDAARMEFVDMMDQDSAAFKAYGDAVHLPKETPADKEHRRAAMQEALKGAAKAPLAVAARICDFTDLLVATFSSAPKSIASDLYVGAAMLEAGFSGAVANVYVNLAYIKDTGFAGETQTAIQKCQQRIVALSSFKMSIGRLLGIS